MRDPRLAQWAFAVLAVVFLSAPVQAAPITLPLEPGIAVATCRSGFNGATPQPFVVAAVDVRDPICEAPGFNQHWPTDFYHNEATLSPTGLASDEWSQPNLGEVFGIALDDVPNIYVASTTSYGNFGGSGRVFRLDGTTGEVSTLVTLPNTGQGLGNVAYDHNHQQLFVTNFEDGKIYRLSLAGAILDTYDPFTPDDGAPGFAPLSERIWGIQVLDCHLYFGTFSEHFSAPGSPNTVWSIDLDATGGFAGTEQLQVTLVPTTEGGTTMPIADIAFSADGRMMVAQRGMRSDTQPVPHQQGIMEYVGGHGAWAPSPNTFGVGIFSGGRNSAGGVDYDCAQADACNAGGHVIATGDALNCCTAPNNIYGLQILPDTGGTVANSYLIDLDNEVNFQDKTQIGDVDSVRTCFATCPTCAPPGPDCTFTQGYWKNHNSNRKNPNQQIAWPIPETTLLCGKTWLEILETPPRGDPWYILAHQWIAARLNAANGASTTADVDDALAAGGALLAACAIDPADTQAAIAYSETLDDYNNGVIGPGHCP